MTIELCGRGLAEEIRTGVRSQALAWQARGITPRMVTLLIEGDPASAFYANAKRRTAQRIGIELEVLRFPADTTENELLDTIHELNENPHIHGIMTELPLPRSMDTNRVIGAIRPDKDIDGLTPHNKLANLSGTPGIYPATPEACVRLAEHHGFKLAGKHAVLVGCGQTVGQPLLHLLLRRGATVTVCHIGTPDLRVHTRQADILFVAVGKPGLIRPDMVHEKLWVIDAGINEAPDKGIVGDVDPDAAQKVAACSPVPGGVGPVTTALLFANLMQALTLQQPHPVPAQRRPAGRFGGGIIH
ncbi:bifunctional 5,10-methylenetetrahydrofolate dehydrogenase/5,10-methenyltetrahydrofolate cyclohydrolase [Alicyclobacillus herbarius]|uniref:bifunctional 5,10-methylenetetrahydrofolate dehydrogenase/5,10-methenyltetrahydrofolate cyclohydrolase n=1 Tax=Alicyclobacillus herbarius TaxID=122960 RepID=UPI000405AA97|nr:bifunctional 5,10-methylenetetrahydrofolate dehydrogenase/5,10-methenyltetrahydrofolate cyclohydrolase [Alicyclobacillus herbarius]